MACSWSPWRQKPSNGYHGCSLCDHSDKLARGEKVIVLLIAQDKRAAKVSLDDAEGAFESTPMLRQLIKERKREELVLTNGITLEVRAQRFAAFAAQLALQ